MTDNIVEKQWCIFKEATLKKYTGDTERFKMVFLAGMLSATDEIQETLLDAKVSCAKTAIVNTIDKIKVLAHATRDTILTLKE